MKFEKICSWIFRILVFLSLLTPVLVSKDFLFPFVTTKAFYFRIVVELALPFYVYLLSVRREYRPNIKQPLSLCILFFVIINLISAFTGVNVNRSLWGNFERMGGVFYLAHLALLYFYLLLLAKISVSSLAAFLKTAVNLSVLLVVYGMLMRILSSANWLLGFTAGLKALNLDFLIVPDPSLPARSSITFGNPIYVGSFLIVPLFLAVFFALQSVTFRSRLWWYFAAFLELLGVYYSGTRGALVGLIIGLFAAGLVYLFFEEVYKKRMYMSVVLSVFLLSAFALFLLSNQLPANFSRIVKLKDSNSEARIIQWQTALSGYKDRPILGTGPENYYVISDQYHNPDIYNYDRSWFDKPHNFLLEILVTTGMLGFIAYLGMIFFAGWNFFKAYKNETLGLSEFCLLIAGLLVYQIQNLFVFDNIAASLMFYLFLGFAGFLGQIKPELPQPKKKQSGSFGQWQYAAFALTVLISAYMVYVGNVLPARAAKDVNYGYAYSGIDTKVAFDYFAQAIDNPFNFDIPETAMKFSDFASSLSHQNITNASPSLVKDSLDKAQGLLEAITQSQSGNYPVYWQKLAQIYLVKDYISNSAVEEKVDDALKKAISLAPKRTEAMSFYADVKFYENKPQEAVEYLRKILAVDPSNYDAAWELATAESSLGHINDAVMTAQNLLKAGHEPKSLVNIGWLANYYRKQNDIAAFVGLYEHAATLNLLDLPAYEDLVKGYIVLGQKEKAANLANILAKQYPEASVVLQSLLTK